MNGMKGSPVARIRIISICIFIFAALIIMRLYSVQIVSGDIYSSKADRQYLQSAYDYFDRGSIFFSTKDGQTVSAASLKTGFIISMTPRLVTDPEGHFAKLSQIIEVDSVDFHKKVAKKDDPYEEIARRVTAEKADAIQKLKLPGIQVSRERWRYYPGNSLAAHALGFIAYKEDELAGRYGLERYYEDTLARNNDSVYVNFFAEIFSNIQDGISGNSALEGDVVTTIEPSAQLFLEESLEKINSERNSSYSGGIIMNPMNGEIIAMALAPTFDPNNLQNQKNSNIFKNNLVESVYEMGSIVKPLTIAAGIDAGAIKSTTTYYDSGSMTLNGRTFSNFDGKARGTVSMQEVLNQSLNTGVAYVVRQMGKEKFADYMRSYGLGQETGIDLPNEIHGLIDNLNSPRDIEYATASFGQGIAVTPIEMIRALATLGNGGKLVNPHIAKQINYKIGGSKDVNPGVEVQVLKPETSEEISRMLVTVVDKALLGGTVKMDHYSIAAKTGTAQIAKENGRGYYEDRYLHSFFGYFPAFSPRFIVFLFAYDPKGVRYASETLTHPFMDITKFLINYYQIPPDR
jgi:stage V sporulation protein D (sporulation-specific penicillin-binding protein)